MHDLTFFFLNVPHTIHNAVQLFSVLLVYKNCKKKYEHLLCIWALHLLFF